MPYVVPHMLQHAHGLPRGTQQLGMPQVATQGMQQGNDIGTQYRSCIYASTDIQLAEAEASKVTFMEALATAGYPKITTEVKTNQTFYYAEDYHQQYLAKVPNGYCGLGGTGVCYPNGSGQ